MAKRASIRQQPRWPFLINTPSAAPPADWAAVFVTLHAQRHFVGVLPASSLLKGIRLQNLHLALPALPGRW